ncbi:MULTISPECIES: amidohydrolase family protein [Arthrobacter]|uniref:Amidohydrolase family protein n=2 Tax=Arthrobacter TaxID=1663 RepID=A0ABU9KGA6_9MICC|nr:amidohydrolase family protein [Arthrobacter sp. YJM1]MDP5225571.1 amidohydrolase family protein [Arthrobacter sp. YJM1]
MPEMRHRPLIEFTGPVLLGPDDEALGLWSVDGRLTFRMPPREPDIRLDGWVLPGLVDAHCHIGLTSGGAADEDLTLRQARTDLRAGTLLVRDAGSPADTRWLAGHAESPKILRSARHVAASRRYLRGLAIEVEARDLVDTVRQQAKLSMEADTRGWVKLVGDWIDRSEGDLKPSFPADVLAEAVAAAHEEGARVTAHCFGEEVLDDVIAAGIDCIEHATGLQEEHLPKLVERGIPIVPTLVNIATFPDIAAQAEPKFPVYAAHMQALWERRYENVARAHAAGVRIYAGTDAGTVIAHGRLAEEIHELHRAGLTTTQSLDAACWGSRSWLGAEGLEEGAPADAVIYTQDPRKNLAVLATPRHVILDGSPVGG